MVNYTLFINVIIYELMDNNMVNYTLFTNIIIYDLMDNNIGKLHFICAFHCFSRSLHCNYKKLTRRLSFRIKTTQRFLSVSSHGQHMPI